MSAIILPKHLDIEAKVALMEKDARFEVAADLDAERASLADPAEEHIRSKTGPAKIPKMFLASKCVFNCAYCECRCGREDRLNYCNSPRELAELAVKAARQNGHGVFVTSAIFRDSDTTQEMLAECVRIMRCELGYRGFIHSKVMPGADPLLIQKTGLYANRLSVNIEVAKSEGYARIAKQKNKTNILTPMRTISNLISHCKAEGRSFATSQTTQLMAGSTEEDDRTILDLSQALYRVYHLKRVYYTAFHYTQDARGYEEEHLQKVVTPYWRMARLYQADRLIQLYGFTPDEITPESQPNLQQDMDPKTAWALRHLDQFPVEVNKADYEILIRVPGIGIANAKKIIEARKYCTVTHDVLRKMRISLKRCVYFITCNGQYRGGNLLFSPDLRSYLAGPPEQLSITASLVAGGCG